MKTKILFAALTLSSVLYAQDSVYLLQSVTVTSSLNEKKISETGRNVFTIRGNVFYTQAVQSLDEFLRYLPGVEIQQRGKQGSQSDIVIRGGTFQQVLVLIDGMRINDPLTGHFSMYIPIHPSEIERIEILKGPAAALWGSEAVGGVINIITKTFQKNTLRKHFRFRGQAGEYELFNGDVSYHSQIGKTSFAAGLITNHAKGEPLRGTTGFFHNTTASASAGFSLKKDWRIHVRMAGDIRHFNAQNFYTTFFSDTAKENVKSWWNHVHIYKKANNGYWQSDISFKRLQDIFYFRPSTAPNKNFTTSLNAQMLRSLRWKKLQFTGGVQSLMRQIKSNDRGNHQLWHTAFFGILQHQIGNHFFLNESVRLGWDENYGWIFVPQFSASYTKEKLTLRSSAGRSFRDADFTERYNNYNKPVVTAGRIGNPFLNAERSFSAEIGFDYKFTPSLTIRSSGFGNFHKGLIDWVPTPYSQMPRQVNLIPNGNYALARNIEDVQTLGAECDAVYYKEWGTGNHVMLTAGMIWMHNRNPDSLPAFYLNGFARFLKNFSFSLRYGSFTFSMNGLYKLRNAQKANAIQAEISRSYFVLNAKISYLFWKQRGMIFVMADNLFDTRYSDILGARMPGRWISGGFQIDLPKF